MKPLLIDAQRSRLYRARTAAQVAPVTAQAALAALQRYAVARRILAKCIQIADGERVGARLNLNVLRSTGLAVNTVHRGSRGDRYRHHRGWWAGEVIGYQPVVTLRNAYLNVGQLAREKIAMGTAAKGPMASVDGEYDDEPAPSFDGIELHFNPKREHLFRDADGYAVRFAEHVTITGNAVFARGLVEYYTAQNAPERLGEAPSAAILHPVPGSRDASRPRSASSAAARPF